MKAEAEKPKGYEPRPEELQHIRELLRTTLQEIKAFPPAPVDKKGFALWYGCHVRHVDNLIAKHAVPYFKVLGQVRFDLGTVAEHFRQRSKVNGG